MKDKRFQKITSQALAAVAEWEMIHGETESKNTGKVLDAFRRQEINYQHFQLSSGYGLGDRGRDTLERLWADILGAEEALIRQQIVSGTHSIGLALFGCLLPGDHMVILGEPYDTLFKVIGRNKQEPGTLLEWGIDVTVHPLEEAETVADSFRERTKLLYIQRSKGYCLRNALLVDEIGEVIAGAKAVKPEIIAFVDNCYGEFTEEKEPIETGADLIAGSLIKNPGGAIALPAVTWRAAAIWWSRLSYRLTAPGIGRELGPSLVSNSYLYQGIFIAPHVVAEAMKGAVYAATAGPSAMMFCPARRNRGGHRTSHHLSDPQKLKTILPQRTAVFPGGFPCAFLEDWEMAGYEDRVIMASGGFVRGSSIELSVDGPMRPPYAAFLQGGTSFAYIRLVLDRIIGEMLGIE